ncbi:MAG TPA: prephenate dehydratase [Solirubrobacteraceae bacterium]|nr:prephenate dehydratase [Solirubrobacteraceae bacterium]
MAQRTLMRLGYLGPAGTFSEEAARAALDGGDAELVGLATVRDTILAVHDGSVDRAIVPIENSLEGPVGVTLDTLADDNDVAVVGELVLGVSQHLIAGSQLALDAIERVLSHPQAISQCARFLRERVPRAAIEPASSTAEAARLVVARDEPWAAIGTLRAAAIYGATVLAESVEDEPGNATRFVFLARRAVAQIPAGGTPAKTSLAFWGSGDDSPGWLVRCLSEFAFRGVNLTKIESRPLRMRLGHYRFFVDCEGSASETSVAEAVEGLRKHCEQVRILGSYAAAGPPD